MADELFHSSESVECCALFLGQQLDLRQFRDIKPLATAPLTISAGADGVAILFRYGVAVLVGMQSAEITRLVADLRNIIIEPFAQPEKEFVEITADSRTEEGIIQGRIRLHSFRLERLQVVADVLAKSVVLSHYEKSLSKHFDRIEPLAEGLTEGRIVGPRGRELLAHIGDALMIEAKMTGRIEVSETPELIWDHPELERLYLRLEDEYELAGRHGAIDRKLELISKTAQTLLDLIHARRSLRVEWYIVILIVVEIVIILVEMLV